MRVRRWQTSWRYRGDEMIGKNKAPKIQFRCQGGPFDGQCLHLADKAGTMPIQIRALNKFWNGSYKHDHISKTPHGTGKLPILTWVDA